MLSISTANLVSAVALGFTLTSLVLATGPKMQCDEEYLIKQGYTCASIAKEAGISLSAIQSMNPGVNCGDQGDNPLPVGGHLCTRQYQPICTLYKQATSNPCNSLAEKWEITVADFVEYNDNVNAACNDLVIGGTYCLSIDGCYPGNTNPLCPQ